MQFFCLYLRLKHNATYHVHVHYRPHTKLRPAACRPGCVIAQPRSKRKSALWRAVRGFPFYPPQVAFKPLQGLKSTPAAAFLRLGHKFKTTFLLISAAVCTAVPAQAAHPAVPDSAAARGWYLGAEGGVPFAVSTFSSFAGGRTYGGWQAGVSAGYAFGRTVSLEAQASWGRPALAARRCCTESGYWLGSDGRRYYAPASGMEGWDYRSLESRATVQSYGLQLNLNVLPLLGAGRQGRWRLEISPRIAAVGTKARLYERATGRRVKSLPARWHMGAGFRLQGSCAVAGRLRLGVYTGMTFLTGKGLDGIPRHAHSSNYLWESGVRLSFHFGKAKAEAARPAYVPPVVPVQPEPQPQPAEEKPTPVIAEQPGQEPAAPKAQQKKTLFPTIYFDFNSSAVRPSERGKAETIASMMASDPAMRVRLTGWCDRRGSVPVNQRVSLRRAEAVKRLLVSLGIDAERIEVDGKGTDHTQPEAAKARRVEAVNIEEVEP